jgi:hypothetical protein
MIGTREQRPDAGELYFDRKAWQYTVDHLHGWVAEHVTPLYGLDVAAEFSLWATDFEISPCDRVEDVSRWAAVWARFCRQRREIIDGLLGRAGADAACRLAEVNLSY